MLTVNTIVPDTIFIASLLQTLVFAAFAFKALLGPTMARICNALIRVRYEGSADWNKHMVESPRLLA